MRTVAALFLMDDSNYKTLPGVECYDAERDALTFDGDCPVVAHPPCRLWGKLRYFSTAPKEEKGLAIWAIDQVRRCGGVLEHPASSTLWHGGRLPIPDGLPDEYGGYTIQVDQFHWGHKAQKTTWLYVCGCPASQLPIMPHREGKPSHVIASSTRRARRLNLKHVNKKDRLSTPIAFAEWLVEVARRSNSQVDYKSNRERGTQSETQRLST